MFKNSGIAPSKRAFGRLALAKGIVEAHGGRIWVESRGYDETHFPGSHFHVLLPLSKPEKGEQAGVEMGREIKMTL